MQRKQQVGECWVCVIFFACVCVGADMTTADVPRGVPGGAGMPPLVTHLGQCPQFFFWAVFAIFSGLLKIIPVLGIRVLVSTEYLKTLYILYSEW
jgi:hypothetical protein